MSAEHSIEKDKQEKVNNSFIHKIDGPLEEEEAFTPCMEFNLILTICGIEFNVISLKKQIKTVNLNIPGRGESIYRRELYMNLNYKKGQ
jgi:hypothetical protein